MGWRVAVVLVLFPLFAAVTSNTYNDDDDDDVIGFSTENETEPTVSTFPESMPLVLNITDLVLPSCSDDELMVFDGLILDCVSIPDRPCRCPGPAETTGEPATLLQPPVGCIDFEPPERGALVCRLIEGVQIYCSVVCTGDSEFSSFPLNPYTCGALTNFKWIDAINRTTSFLPDCFPRISLPVYSRENYLPRACTELSGEEFEALGEEFCRTISYTFITFDFGCTAEDIFIRCGNT